MARTTTKTAATTAAPATAAKPARKAAAVKPAAKPSAAKPDKPAAKAKPAPAAKPTLAPKPAPKTKPAPKAKTAPAAKKAPARKAPRARKPIAPDRLEALVKAAVQSLEDDKADNIVVLDVTGRASYADRLIVASGQVERQLQAMASHVEDALAKEGLKLKRDDMQASPEWVLIDAGDLIVHLFLPDTRATFNLEKLWSGAAPQDAADPI
ncbi:MAG: ribosome silencing factor [Alphaproteobacteria bacterium]|nr:ribosome silencing factor [Alphaproteobacteria bacterium]